jgi:ABC-type sulfate transport system permease component
MSMAVIGLVVGMALAFAGYFGGFGAFLLVAALGAVGFVVGKFIDGDIEPGDFFRSRDRDRDRRR